MPLKVRCVAAGILSAAVFLFAGVDRPQAQGVDSRTSATPLAGAQARKADAPSGAARGESLPQRRAAEKKPLEVVFFDVRQGDSTLICTPGGKHILIDGGKCRARFSSFDAAERVIIPYLKKHGIKKLNLVIGTHPDFDHIGGLTTLFKDRDIEVGTYLDPGKEHTTSYYREILELVKERGIRYRVGRAGNRLEVEKGLKAEIVSPARLFDDNNNCSIVLRLKYGKASFLFTGDAEEEAEARMIGRYGRSLRSVVLKAGHHGSRGSSSMKFLRMVNPKIVAISCGRNNQFGHPHKETLERFRRIGAKVLRTDELGTFTIRTDGKTLKVVREKGDDAYR